MVCLGYLLIVCLRWVSLWDGLVVGASIMLIIGGGLICIVDSCY